eukprot:295270_1
MSKETYTWNLASITPLKSVLLCHGYIRFHCETLDVPNTVSYLVLSHFEKKTISNFTRGGHANACIHSQIFMIGGLKWILKLYPLISDTKCQLVIRLLSTCIPQLNLHTNLSCTLSIAHAIEKQSKENWRFTAKGPYATLIFKSDPLTQALPPTFAVNITMFDIPTHYDLSKYVHPLRKAISDEYLWHISSDEIHTAR